MIFVVGTCASIFHSVDSFSCMFLQPRMRKTSSRRGSAEYEKEKLTRQIWARRFLPIHSVQRQHYHGTIVWYVESSIYKFTIQNVVEDQMTKETCTEGDVGELRFK